MTVQENYLSEQVNELMDSVPELDEYGRQVKQVLHNAVLDGGKPVRQVVDLLHGTWLGHPLHPVLTDVTIGAWLLSGLFDVLSMFGSRSSRRAADTLLMVGTASGVATAVTGLADYSTIPNPAVRAGALHGLLNAGGLVLNLFSGIARKTGNRGAGMALSSVALGILGFSAWLGGELVFRHRVGINHAEPRKTPESWTRIMAEFELEEGVPRRVDVDGQPVLFYRKDGRVHAIGAVCSHAGGPLEDGQFYDNCVQCPWHDSVFDLRDGSVVHGPATYGQPLYETRIYDGGIEVRVAAR